MTDDEEYAELVLETAHKLLHILRDAYEELMMLRKLIADEENNVNVNIEGLREYLASIPSEWELKLKELQNV